MGKIAARLSQARGLSLLPHREMACRWQGARRGHPVPVGAGGGGFLLFYSEDHRRLRTAMAKAKLEEVRFRFDFEGTKVLFG